MKRTAVLLRNVVIGGEALHRRRTSGPGIDIAGNMRNGNDLALFFGKSDLTHNVI